MNSRKLPHLRKKAEIIVARETVGAETNIEAESAQLLERERRMTEERMAARAMHNVEARCSFEQRKIFRRDFVQMRNNPAVVDEVATIEHPRNGSSPATIIHIAANLLHEIEQLAA